MGHFPINMKSRAWIGTVQVKNMEKAGLSEENYRNPQFLAKFLMDTWSQSGKDRTAGVSICVSAGGLYHAHVALYGNLTTLKNVSRIMYDSHIEPQLGGKKELVGYLTKEPPYDESGETVLYTYGLENIQDRQGNRSDLEEIQEMLDSGMTPNEIMRVDIKYRRNERIIRGAFFDKRFCETPIKRDVRVFWHTGESRTGKSYTCKKLAEKYGEENIYLMSDYNIGGLDTYMGEKILFMDEFKGGIPFQVLLDYLEGYRKQIHCRYSNAYALWNEVHITSIYPPDEVYELMTNGVNRKRDSIKQLLARIDTITYHFQENGEYKTFSIPAAEYIDYKNLKQRALGDKDGFVPVDIDKIFFNKEEQHHAS